MGTPPGDLPLVGREAEMHLLRDLVSGTSRRGRGLVFTGEPGVGSQSCWSRPECWRTRRGTSFSGWPLGLSPGPAPVMFLRTVVASGPGRGRDPRHRPVGRLPRPPGREAATRPMDAPAAAVARSNVRRLGADASAAIAVTSAGVAAGCRDDSGGGFMVLFSFWAAGSSRWARRAARKLGPGRQPSADGRRGECLAAMDGHRAGPC
jgi:hypothetical protein